MDDLIFPLHKPDDHVQDKIFNLSSQVKYVGAIGSKP